MTDISDTPLTTTLEDYLVAIFKLETANGVARASDVALAQGVSRSTVTSALKALSARDLIVYSPYSHIRLTPRGLPLAREIAHRNMILTKFFRDVLMLDQDLADATACRVEHAVDARVVRRLGKFILYLERSGMELEKWLDEYETLMRRAPHPGPQTHLPG